MTDDDAGNLWDGLKARSQVKRSQNRISSAELLRAANIPFESNNMGAHLVVTAGSFVVDFWPGTGKWIARENSATHMRGVRSLVSWCKSRIS